MLDVSRGREGEMAVERGEISGKGRLPAPLTCPCSLSQLVAGIKYYLTLEMGSTACRKNAVAGDGIDLTTCPLAAGTQEEVTACLPHTPCLPAPGSLRLSSPNWSGWPG